MQLTSLLMGLHLTKVVQLLLETLAVLLVLLQVELAKLPQLYLMLLFFLLLLMFLLSLLLLEGKVEVDLWSGTSFFGALTASRPRLQVIHR